VAGRAPRCAGVARAESWASTATAYRSLRRRGAPPPGSPASRWAADGGYRILARASVGERGAKKRKILFYKERFICKKRGRWQVLEISGKLTFSASHVSCLPHSVWRERFSLAT
jgi:hypothetical protein